MPNNMLAFNILLINVGGSCDTKVKIWRYRLISLVLNWELMVYLSEACKQHSISWHSNCN